jgi:hypothetical protein
MNHDLANLLMEVHDDLGTGSNDAGLLAEVANLLEWHREYMANDEAVYVRIERVKYSMSFNATYYCHDASQEGEATHLPYLVEIDPTQPRPR